MNPPPIFKFPFAVLGRTGAKTNGKNRFIRLEILVSRPAGFATLLGAESRK